MIYNPHTTEAFNLLMQGALAFQRAESQGFTIDLEYTNRAIHRLEVKMKDLEQEFKETKFFRHWEHVTGGKLNINSGVQLSNYLYNIKKLTPAKLTDTGKGSTDEEALEQLNIPELNILARKNRLKKCKDVLTGYLTEQVDGVLHPSYNLHLVTTYRSSSNSPNMQNVPKRDEEAMKICRRAIIPRAGHQLIEVDMSGAEVKISACYHKDEMMLKYINDPSTDMHRDMARQIFLLDEFDKSKHATLRQAAKNGFVFPQFYGDWYKNCAANLACNWGQLSKGKWKPGEGILIGDENLSDHLIEKGISSFSKFEDHIKDIEHDFWTNRFSEYNQWKDRWWGAYKKNGYFTMLTGFMCQGVLGKKEVTNYPVQGAAFHCLLKSFVLVDEIMRKEKWDSRLIGQVHDSMILCVNPAELEHVNKTVETVVSETLPHLWKWIITPLTTETEIYDVDKSWAEKKKL